MIDGDSKTHSPTRKRLSGVDALELTRQTVTQFTVGRRILAAVASVQLIIDAAGEFEF